MRPLAIIFATLALLAGCSTHDLSDPRAQALMTMPGPQHYAERRIARELAGRCPTYAYDESLAEAMTREKVTMGQATSVQVQGASDLESDIKRRSLAARYGADYASLNPCTVLDGETAQGTPMSILVKRRG